VLHRIGQTRAAEEALGEAGELLSGRSRFVWTWIQGATDADILYDLAATLATLGRTEEAFESLRRAADAGWADAVSLREDPAFAVLRDSTEMRQLLVAAAGRVVLPAPVGSGGIS
jgi:tetratricopeptide (TPR) repeat protein